jgi:16S rRNA (adenine1518-N6/adenine1519-N6)-dimethyltransferase
VTHTRRQLLALLERHDLEPSRALGQNFVVDPNTVRRIARLAAVGPGDHVLEVGAGLGSLTLALAESGATVTAVEADRYLIPPLTEALAGRGVRIVAGDALHLDWPAVLEGRPHVLVANLPYNLAAGLVLDLLAEVPEIVRMLVMVQREVGERLAAGPGSRTYGIPSVKRAWWADARVVATVPATVFVPRPKVDSVLLEVVRRAPPADDPGPVFALVEAGFGQRRKMLRSSLAARVAPDAFTRAGVAPTARAEELDVGAWLRLARAAAGSAVDRPGEG